MTTARTVTFQATVRAGTNGPIPILFTKPCKEELRGQKRFRLPGRHVHPKNSQGMRNTPSFDSPIACTTRAVGSFSTVEHGSMFGSVIESFEGALGDMTKHMEEKTYANLRPFPRKRTIAFDAVIVSFPNPTNYRIAERQMFQMKMDREAPMKTTATTTDGEASAEREVAGPNNNASTKRPSITAGMLQAAGNHAWNAYGGESNEFLSDTSLTDFLFDDDINLNEPLPLITSAGGAAGGTAGSGDPEQEGSTASLLQDSWQQPPPVIPLPAHSSNAVLSATAANTGADFPSTANSSSSSTVMAGAGGTMSTIFSASASSSTTNNNASAVETGTPVSGPPSKNDVLLGRGGRNNQWSGNELLRTMAKFMADRYAQAQKRDKPGLAWILVTQMRQLDPPTRYVFLFLLGHFLYALYIGIIRPVQWAKRYVYCFY
jgi:hypothetical protein